METVTRDGRPILTNMDRLRRMRGDPAHGKDFIKMELDDNLRTGQERQPEANSDNAFNLQDSKPTGRLSP